MPCPRYSLLRPCWSPSIRYCGKTSPAWATCKETTLLLWQPASNGLSVFEKPCVKRGAFHFSLVFRTSIYALLLFPSSMKRKLPLPLVGLGMALLISVLGCRYESTACKQRGAAYSARREALERGANEKLRVGTKKDAVIRFFAESG